MKMHFKSVLVIPYINVIVSTVWLLSFLSRANGEGELPTTNGKEKRKLLWYFSKEV